MTCRECGLRGHERDRCFCLAANASRRPAGWTPPVGYTGGGAAADREQGHVHIDNDNQDFELIMVHTDIALEEHEPMPSLMRRADYNPSPLALSSIADMQFPSHQGSLRDPNSWLADTSASMRITGNLPGTYNLTP